MAYNIGDYNRGGMKVFAFVMIFSVLFFIYVGLVHHGIEIDQVEGEPKAEVPAGQQQAAAPAAPAAFDPSKVKEPWVESQELVARGKELFEQNCQMCHGPKGEGDGPAGTSLNPPPRNLVKGDWKKGGTKVGLFKVVTEGIPGSSMAPWAHLPEVDRWALVHFVQTITKNKVADKPDELKAFVSQQK